MLIYQGQNHIRVYTKTKYVGLSDLNLWLILKFIYHLTAILFFLKDKIFYLFVILLGLF